MPYRYRVIKGSKAGNDSGQSLFSCCLNTSGSGKSCDKCRKCQAHLTKRRSRNGPRYPRCKLSTCKDFKYCSIHLKYPFMEKDRNGVWKRRHIGVRIAPSTIPNAGLGLFATRKFRKNEQVAEMGGVRMTYREVKEYYEYMDEKGSTVTPTLPYAIRLSDNDVLNADCLRGAGSYANSKRGRNPSYNAKIGNKWLRATKNINPGDEIFVPYGRSYWRTSGPQYISHSTKTIKSTRKPGRSPGPRSNRSTS